MIKRIVLILMLLVNVSCINQGKTEIVELTFLYLEYGSNNVIMAYENGDEVNIQYRYSLFLIDKTILGMWTFTDKHPNFIFVKQGENFFPL